MSCIKLLIAHRLIGSSSIHGQIWTVLSGGQELDSGSVYAITHRIRFLLSFVCITIKCYNSKNKKLSFLFAGIRLNIIICNELRKDNNRGKIVLFLFRFFKINRFFRFEVKSIDFDFLKSKVGTIDHRASSILILVRSNNHKQETKRINLARTAISSCYQKNKLGILLLL